MASAQNMVVTVFELGVKFLVPAVVWLTLMSGLLQLVFDSVRRLGIALPGSQKFAQRSAR